jgi:hypothetical protein
MSGTKNTADSTTVQVEDTDGTIAQHRIKEVLDLRSQYITTRNEVRASTRTGSLDQADGAELIKASLDSFLLGVRPIILQSEHADVWTDRHIATVKLDESRAKTKGRNGTLCIVQSDEIDIHGLSQLLKINATFTRQWRELTENRGRFKNHVGDIVHDNSLPEHTEIIDFRTFDEGFTLAEDVITQLGFEMNLEDIDSDEWQV